MNNEHERNELEHNVHQQNVKRWRIIATPPRPTAGNAMLAGSGVGVPMTS